MMTDQGFGFMSLTISHRFVSPVRMVAKMRAVLLMMMMVMMVVVMMVVVMRVVLLMMMMVMMMVVMMMTAKIRIALVMAMIPRFQEFSFRTQADAFSFAG